MFFVALTELLAKYLSQGFAVPQIVWARYVLLLVLALILFWPRYGPSLLRSRRPGLQWVRALLHLVANGGFFFALSHIGLAENARSEEHTSELQSLMRISYAVFCLQKKKHTTYNNIYQDIS